MTRLILGSVAAVLLSASSAALAVPLQWTVHDLDFGSGASITGSFVFDAAVGGGAGYSDVNLTLSGAIVASFDGVYDAIASAPGVGSGLLVAYMSATGGGTGDPGIGLVFNPDLSDSGATVAVDIFAYGTCATTTGDTCGDSILAAEQHFQPDGAATSARLPLDTPVPAMAGLLGLAVVGLGLLRRHATARRHRA
jgi:hypothetical protein